jgi:hypothetical protein
MLGHDRDPHSDVEPIEQVLGSGVEVDGHITKEPTAIGEEGDLLIRSPGPVSPASCTTWAQLTTCSPSMANAAP